MQSVTQKMVKDVMNPYLVTISPYETLSAAYEKMRVDNIRRLPVINKHNKLVGIITLHDILEVKPSDVRKSLTFEEIHQLLSTVIVDLVMKKDLITIYQTDTLAHAAEKMLENKIGGLPVLDSSDELVGIVTESDIFRTIVRQWHDENIIAAGE